MSARVLVARKGAQIPMHDHPHTYGLIKLLFGRAIMQPYDRRPALDRGDGLAGAVRQELLVMKCNRPSVTWSPIVNNLHSITTPPDQDTVLLVVVGPSGPAQLRAQPSYYTTESAWDAQGVAYLRQQDGAAAEVPFDYIAYEGDAIQVSEPGAAPATGTVVSVCNSCLQF